MFYGRKNELEKLENEYLKPNSLCSIYGLRRLNNNGKTNFKKLGIVIASFLILNLSAPMLYGNKSSSVSWDDWSNPRIIYNSFNDNNKSMMISGMYEYTLTIPTDQRNNSVKGLSWQAAPGSMMYRADLAESLLGVKTPEEMQEKVKDWDSFLATAREISEKSSGATKILSGPDDVSRVYLSNKSTAWVDEQSNFVIDDKVLEYMDMYKTLVEEGLTNNTTQWTEQWNANCASDNTFAYFGCTWFLHWTIKANCGGEKTGEGTYGKWAMCQGPCTYYWGGTWLCAGANCSDKDLAGQIMKTLCCDTDTMYNIAAETLDYVNNKAAVEKLIKDGKGTYDFLGGQDFLEVFAPLAEKVDVSWMSAYDQKINTALDTQVKAYAAGEKDKDAAVADLKAAVKNDYPAVNVE